MVAASMRPAGHMAHVHELQGPGWHIGCSRRGASHSGGMQQPPQQQLASRTRRRVALSGIAGVNGSPYSSGSPYSNGGPYSSAPGPSPSTAPAAPAAGEPPPNSARAKLMMLQQMKQRSSAALRAPTPTAPQLVDARMYAASMQAQRKLSEKLSEANMYIDVLQQKVASYNEDLQAAAEILNKVYMEFGTTSRLSDAASAAVRFGVDKQDALLKIAKLSERLRTLEQALSKEQASFSKRVPRKVPVTWVGSASEVRLVGSFDNWTRGVELSNPDVDARATGGDDVLRTFEATLYLLPGKYYVKFLVDGEWRLAPEGWAMEPNEFGETNNVLEVT